MAHLSLLPVVLTESSLNSLCPLSNFIHLCLWQVPGGTGGLPASGVSPRNTGGQAASATLIFQTSSSCHLSRLLQSPSASMNKVAFKQLEDRAMSRPARRGFTLIELIITVLIIVVLVALLLPTVSRRNVPAARRNWCRNNLKQIVLALHEYWTAITGVVRAFASRLLPTIRAITSSGRESRSLLILLSLAG